jgi:hypothetical protein
MKKLNLTIIPFLLLGAFIAFLSGFNPAIGAGVVYAGGKMVEQYSNVPNGVSFFAAADLSALAAFPGEYEEKLFSTMINSMDIASDITVLPNVKKKLNLTKLRVKKGARPYSSTHEPDSGDLIYTPRVLTVNGGKRDMLIDPEDYRASWMAMQVGKGGGANKKTIPFEQYVWAQVMIALGAEINDDTAYFGLDLSALTVTAWAGGSTYTGGTDYVTFGSPTRWYKCVTTTTAGQSPSTTPAKWLDITARVITKGLGTIIADEIIASALSVTATGAITDGATAKTAFKKVFRAHSDAYKKAGLITYCSYTDYEFLLDGLSENTKYTNPDGTVGTLYLPETGKKNEIRPVTWLNGSRRLICTPKENLILGTDLLSDMNDISVVQDVYTYKTGIKFQIGFQIRDLSALRVGDQV